MKTIPMNANTYVSDGSLTTAPDIPLHKPRLLDLVKYDRVDNIVPNYSVPHLHHDFPIASMKDIVLATLNPHLKAMRDFLRDEAIYVRKSVDDQNDLIANLQITVTSLAETLLVQMNKLMETNVRTGELAHTKADVTEYQTLTIDYSARMDMYQSQVDDFSKVLSMTIGLMREISLELSKINTGLANINHAYILDNPDVDTATKDGYTQLIASLQLLNEKASDYADNLPLPTV